MANLLIKKVYGVFDLDPVSLKSTILDVYGMKVDSVFDYIDSGFVNVNLSFRASGKKFVIRFYGKFSEFTLEELAIQAEVRALGVVTPSAITDLAGNTVNDFGIYKYAIFDFVDGEIPALDFATAARVGELVGQAQVAFGKLTHDINRRSWIEDKYNRRLEDCDFIEDNMPALEKLLGGDEYQSVTYFVKWYRELNWDAGDVSEQIIHADIYNPNFLDDGERIALLDFEAVAFGPTVIDSMTYIAWDLLAKDENAKRAPQIFKRVESYLNALKSSGGVIENPSFCFELIQGICAGASISNLVKAVSVGHNAFTRYLRYFGNIQFAKAHEDELIQLLEKYST